MIRVRSQKCLKNSKKVKIQKSSLSLSLSLLLIFSVFSLTFTACDGGGGGDGGGGTTRLTDTEAVTQDVASLTADDITFTGDDSPSSVTGDFTLPTSGLNGTTITWEEKIDEGNNIILSGEGNSKAAVTNSSWLETNGFSQTVVLTATVIKGTESVTKDISIIVVPPVKTKVATTVDSVAFKMVRVSGGFTFPAGKSDNDIATVDNAYWIGETEVTYELWEKVYDWATDDARGANKYVFGHVGQIGAYMHTLDKQHPVTEVSRRDSIVWCNALTEWYNEHKEAGYDCVYYTDESYTNPLRTSTTAKPETMTPGSEDLPYIKAATNSNTKMDNCSAKGFRLLTANEWLLAARYRGTDTTNVVTGVIKGVDFDEMETKWTKGDSVSGDIEKASVSSTLGDYAVYYSNSDWGNIQNTKAVKAKLSNALGLHDMSGNVAEFCFELITTSDPKINLFHYKGGTYLALAEHMGLTWEGQAMTMNHGRDDIGFRFAKSE